MTVAARYDPHADWYEHYLAQPGVVAFTDRVWRLLRELLGPGAGRCLEVGCGTGWHAGTLRDLGWTPVGIDLSREQLRYARTRLPVANGDAARLPIGDGSVPAVACLLVHTDLPDYRAALTEIARVLRPGGRFVHIGVHPCFIGVFADWRDRPRVVIDERYADRSHSYDAWCPAGVRAQVGAWHVPLADLLNGVIEAGLSIVRTAEAGAGGVPDLFGLLAHKPGRS
ncbi:MAG TPA: methyltransferase domain-containing protein [Natronosporangium sp.]